MITVDSGVIVALAGFGLLAFMFWLEYKKRDDDDL